MSSSIQNEQAIQLGLELESNRDFKQSELGIIPVDWNIAKINQVTSYVDYRGKTPTKSPEGAFLVTARNIKDGYIDYNASQEFIPTDSYNHVMSRGLPKVGDVLITTEAPLGSVAQIDREDIALAQRVIKYRGKQGVLNNDYFKYFLLSENFQKELDIKATGSTAKGIKGSVLHKLPVILPPFHEQETIAAILSTWDKSIEKLQQLIISKKKRKTALMQLLLTGKKRFKVFTDEWQEVRMEHIFERVKRTSEKAEAKSYTISSKLGFVTQEDKFNRVIAGSSLSKYTLLNSGEFSYNKGNSKTFPYGCIFKFDAEEGLVPFVYISFKLKEGSTDDVDFYKYYFYYGMLERQLKKIITSGARGDGLLNVSAEDFFKLIIHRPSLQEQAKIASVLQVADKEIEVLQQKLNALMQQKKGLMQKLLTGQARVNLKAEPVS